jgi:hypothetical protein
MLRVSLLLAASVITIAGTSQADPVATRAAGDSSTTADPFAVVSSNRGPLKLEPSLDSRRMRMPRPRTHLRPAPRHQSSPAPQLCGPLCVEHERRQSHELKMLLW